MSASIPQRLAAQLDWRLWYDRLRVRLRRMSVAQRVHWLGARNLDEGLYSLVARARAVHRSRPELPVLVVGSDDAVRARLLGALQAHGLEAVAADAQSLPAVADRDYAALLCCALDYAEQQRIAALANAQPRLAQTRFEYLAGLDPAQRQFAEQDEYADTFFVSPVLRDEPGPYAIYAESLRLFEQKCGLRDYLDLYQALRELTRREVPGDIAEFGSYRGHSGWLIARTLQAFGSQRTLWMFDMFESFPSEQLGIDQFWSKTHHVDFDEVQRKLAGFTNVRLVKGDFTRTLPASGLPQLALGYIDCDSYRGTRYLLEALSGERLAVGGMLICEDYGHPALLGNRLAVHETMDGRRDYAHHYSQFSGLYHLTKLAEYRA